MSRKWTRTRSFYPVTRDRVYLDHASVGALSSRVQEALGRFAEAQVHAAGQRASERTRLRAGELIGARPNEIALVPDARQGLALALQSLAWRPGDAILACDFFRRTGVPCRKWLDARGIQVSFAPAGVRDSNYFENALARPQVRVLLTSAVDPDSGARAKLPALSQLCRELGVVLAVDASYAVGALPLDVRALDLDLLAFDGHRWLGSVQGSGVLYCAPRILPALRTPDSLADAPLRDSQPDRDRASRFDAIAHDGPAPCALGAAIDLALELGVPAIADRILELRAYLVAALGAKNFQVEPTDPPAQSSGILCFPPRGRDPSTARDALRARHIHVGHAPEALRVSLHYYNDENDLDALLEVI